VSPAHKKHKPAEVPPEGFGFVSGPLGAADGWHVRQEEGPEGEAWLVVNKDGRDLKPVPMLFPEPLAGKRTRYAEVQWHALPKAVSEALAERVDRGKGDLPVHQLVAALLLGADLRAQSQSDGKPLTVHHQDEQGLSNAASNLLPISGDDHTRLHTAKTRAEREEVRQKWEKMVTKSSSGEKTEKEKSKKTETRTSPLTNPHPDQQRVSGGAEAPEAGASQGKSPGGSGLPGAKGLAHQSAGRKTGSTPKDELLGRLRSNVLARAFDAMIEVLEPHGAQGLLTTDVEEGVMRAMGLGRRQAQEQMSMVSCDEKEPGGDKAIITKSWENRKRCYRYHPERVAAWMAENPKKLR
jgi:hypothetical protein